MELYRPTERRPMSVPTFADRECCLVSITDLLAVDLGFLDRYRYFSFKQLLSYPHEDE
jgi:hypothetical protein